MTDPQAAGPAESGANPSVLEIFLSFSAVAIIGFGGVLPFARRMMVEQKRWLTDTEFNEVMAFSQFLPGGNIVNVAIVVGQRFGGAAGSLAAVAGLIFWPTIVVVAVGTLYVRFGDNPLFHDGLAGMSAAAAGLLAATSAKMAAPLFRRGAGVPLAFAVLACVLVGFLRFPLVPVLAVLAPLSIAAAWRKVR